MSQNKDTLYIAIVEDSKQEADTIISYLKRYEKEKGEHFIIAHHLDSASFLENFKPSIDLVLMDIELPGLNGMETVKKLRELNSDVLVIFITNMAQYAVKGYEVHAFDFIVKPVNYGNFALKLDTALLSVRQKQNFDIWISNKEGKKRLQVSHITYIEVMQHMLIYHTIDGDYKATGSLDKLNESLKDQSFSLCNRCYLVNLKYVTAVKQNSIIVNKDELQVSRMKKVSFLKDLNNFLALKS